MALSAQTYATRLVTDHLGVEPLFIEDGDLAHGYKSKNNCYT
jgi:hypothetical protein